MAPQQRRRPARLIALTAAVLTLAAACDSSHRATPSSSAAALSSIASPPDTSPAPSPSGPGASASSPVRSRSAVSSSSPRPSSSAATSHRASTPAPASTGRVASAPVVGPVAPVATVPAGTGPVIVLDPGHSVTISATDPATDLNVSDYENEPEMHDVFSVALLVRAQLQRAGYRVVMTKNSVDAPTSLGQRAAVANSVHAALALSIHDQAGSNGGIGFDSGNNIVYYQSVGNYRVAENGKRITFTNAAVAALSARYGQIFQTEREATSGHPVTLLGNTGYDLGSRGLPAGNIWTVQLLSTVPWIYNEAGGNSAGQSGLDAQDQQTYANGLVAAVERCVPV